MPREGVDAQATMSVIEHSLHCIVCACDRRPVWRSDTLLCAVQADARGRDSGKRLGAVQFRDLMPSTNETVETSHHRVADRHIPRSFPPPSDPSATHTFLAPISILKSVPCPSVSYRPL